MKYFLGIDLGSTTTKAVAIDENGQILGRGITNSRSNYAVACHVARNEALANVRFSFLTHRAEEAGLLEAPAVGFVKRLHRGFLLATYLSQLRCLKEGSLEKVNETRYDSTRTAVTSALSEIFHQMEEHAPALFDDESGRRSDFFRDLAGAQYQELAEHLASEDRVPFEVLMGVFDSVILSVENHVPEGEFESGMVQALDRAAPADAEPHAMERWRAIVREASATPLEETGLVGTGYGRQTLPFPKDCVRSEILCHGYGAHALFERTATVLDIGGQDTKAIQLDRNGVVTNFQMNDRCAAGCGRYLGYIADELNLGLHQLGPIALKSKCRVKINSTCTVFAGAELRDRLAIGDKREDILAGLHRAMILRAMSLLARSGGIRDEFTFTGGVAKNRAAVRALTDLVRENYGEVTINIHPDSIYTGALGAALFALEGSPVNSSSN